MCSFTDTKLEGKSIEEPEKFEDFMFISTKEEGEKCLLVEKSIVDKFRKEKEKYTKTENKLTNEIEDLKKDYLK